MYNVYCAVGVYFLLVAAVSGRRYWNSC